MGKKLDKIKESIDIQIIEVTPMLAKTILGVSSDFNNRKVSKCTVKKYAEDMREGRWLFNALPLIFTKAGKLMDGQHRLEALILANKSEVFLAIYGIDEDAFPTIDANKTKKLADDLSKLNVVDNEVVAGFIRLWYSYSRTSENAKTRFSKGYCQRTKALQIYDTLKYDIHECIEYCRGTEIIGLNHASFMYCECRKIDKELADWLFKELAIPMEQFEVLDNENPLKWYYDRVKYIKSQRGKIEVEDLLKNLCGLWNMYRLKGKEFFSSNTII